jgi:hypothetical protein
MAEDTETQLIAKIKKNRNCLHYNWTILQIFRTIAFYLYMCDILTMMNVKKDILSVSELPTHTTSREIFKVSNGFY